MPPNDSLFFQTGDHSTVSQREISTHVIHSCRPIGWQCSPNIDTSTSKNKDPRPDSWVLGRVSCYSVTSKWLQIEPRVGGDYVYLHDATQIVTDLRLLMIRRALIKFVCKSDSPTEVEKLKIA